CRSPPTVRIPSLWSTQGKHPAHDLLGQVGSGKALPPGDGGSGLGAEQTGGSDRRHPSRAGGRR
ncbi:MAG: hypothetical protein ACK55I_02735, partial [bacterium]